jgi:hypothetical protein
LHPNIVQEHVSCGRGRNDRGDVRMIDKIRTKVPVEKKIELAVGHG